MGTVLRVRLGCRPWWQPESSRPPSPTSFQVLASLLKSRLSPVAAHPASQPRLEHIPQTVASSWPCLAHGCCATSADPLRHWLPQYPDAGLCGAHGTYGPKYNPQTRKSWAPAPPPPISFSSARARVRWRRPSITPDLHAYPTAHTSHCWKGRGAGVW